MISLYIASTVGYSGKSMVCLGIGNRLSKDGFRFSYMKPIGKTITHVGDLIIDEDAVFITRALSLSEPLETICPIVLTQDLIAQAYRNKIQGLDQKILQAHQKLSEDRDVVLIGGANNLDEGAFLGLSGKYIIKNLLNAKVVLINDFSSEACVDHILGVQEDLADRLIGVVFNRINQEKIEYIQRRIVPFLSSKGIDVLAIIPPDQILNSVTVKELTNALNAQVLCCEDRLDELVENFSIGAMTVDRALAYFRQKINKAVITGGDRAEIQLAALETSTRCIILTGNLFPSEIILAQAEDRHVPIMVVNDDTLTTVEKTERIFGRIRVRDKRKMNRAIELVDQYLDFPILYKKLGLT